MTGRHRLNIRRNRARKITAGAAGALGATTLVMPMTAGVASAATPGPGLAPHVGPTTSSNDSHQSRGERVVHAAAKEWGHPYMYGGDGPIAFDCSGLTKYVYGKFGVNLPHNAAEQYQVVNHVSKSDMRLGDLVFIYDNEGIFHVGIYAGHHEMWEAPHTGDYVRKEKIWTDSFVVGRP